MKLRYFVVDVRGRLRRVSQAAVKGLWAGTRRAESFGCRAGNELRLVSILCNDRLLPRKVYLLRLPLSGGVFTPESHLTLRLFCRRDCVTAGELVRHHTEGWPPDFFGQLAVALDVPVAALEVPFGIGGPLLLAAALRVTPREALRFLR